MREEREGEMETDLFFPVIGMVDNGGGDWRGVRGGDGGRREKGGEGEEERGWRHKGGGDGGRGRGDGVGGRRWFSGLVG